METTNQRSMTKDEKRQRINAIERELLQIKSQQKSCDELLNTCRQSGVTTQIKLFSSYGSECEDSRTVSVWLDGMKSIPGVVLLKLYKAELDEQVVLLTAEVEKLIA